MYCHTTFLDNVSMCMLTELCLTYTYALPIHMKFFNMWKKIPIHITSVYLWSYLFVCFFCLFLPTNLSLVILIIPMFSCLTHAGKVAWLNEARIMIFEVLMVANIKTVPTFSSVGNSVLFKSQITAFNCVM